MTSNNDPISSSFGLSPIPKKDIVNDIISESHNDSAIKDFELARSNIISMIDTIKNSIENLSQISDSSQQPRSYEVLAKLMDSHTSMNVTLLNLQEKIRQLKNIDEPHNDKAKTINNNLFVGSTAELSKILKELKEKDE